METDSILSIPIRIWTSLCQEGCGCGCVSASCNDKCEVKWHEKAPDHDDWLCDFKRSYQCYRYTLPDPTLYIYFAIHRGVSVLFEAHQLLYYLVEEKLTLRKISISRFVMCLKQKWERNASVYHTCYMYMYTPRCKMWLCVRRIRGRNTLIWQWDKALWKLFL